MPPYSVYGSLKPGELAHQQISPYVAETGNADLEGHHLRTRDGLPLLVPGGAAVKGALVVFGDSQAGYDAVRWFEPRAQYRWSQVRVEVDGEAVMANTLLAELPEEGSENEALESWSSTDDPVLVEGISQAAELARPVLSQQWHSAPFEGEFVRQFFQLEAAYLLLMSAVERLGTFLFGLGVAPTTRVKKLGNLEGFPNWWQAAGGQPGRRVVDSRDPSKDFSVGENGQGAWEYWYAVRSNLAHRGKGAWRDAFIVWEAFIECHNVVRLTLETFVPAFADRWPDGPDWRLELA